MIYILMVSVQDHCLHFENYTGIVNLDEYKRLMFKS